MGEKIEITTADGSFAAYLAKPASGKGPGIVVIQEIFCAKSPGWAADRAAEAEADALDLPLSQEG